MKYIVQYGSTSNYSFATLTVSVVRPDRLDRTKLNGRREPTTAPYAFLNLKDFLGMNSVNRTFFMEFIK